MLKITYQRSKVFRLQRSDCKCQKIAHRSASNRFEFENIKTRNRKLLKKIHKCDLSTVRPERLFDQDSVVVFVALPLACQLFIRRWAGSSSKDIFGVWEIQVFLFFSVVVVVVSF